MALQETFHRDINGHALNVKTHGVRFADGGTESQRERAWERAQEAWWRDANEAARAVGYAGAGACGRSGGWCAPYDEDAQGRMRFAHKDNDAERFAAFAEKIETLFNSVPEYFAAELSDAIAEDEAEARESEEDRAEYARERAILALVPRLVASLRGAVSCHAYAETDGRGLQGDNAAEWRSVDTEARAALAAFDALQSGDASQPDKPEEMRALVVSTGHVTREEAQEMDACGTTGPTPEHGLVVSMTGDYGWLLYTGADNDEARRDAMSDGLRAVYDYARAHGFDFVRFDNDAGTLTGAPTYEW